jgi:hypothetical protein
VLAPGYPKCALSPRAPSPHGPARPSQRATHRTPPPQGILQSQETLCKTNPMRPKPQLSKVIRSAPQPTNRRRPPLRVSRLKSPTCRPPTMQPENTVDPLSRPSFPAHLCESAVIRACPLDVWRVHPASPLVVGVGRWPDRCRSVAICGSPIDCETNPIPPKSPMNNRLQRVPGTASAPLSRPSFPAHPWESAVIRACPLNVWRACPLDVWRVHPASPVVVGLGRWPDRCRSVAICGSPVDCETNRMRQNGRLAKPIRRAPGRASVPVYPSSFPAHPWESAVIRACPLNVWRACPLDVWRVHPASPVVVGVGRWPDRCRSVAICGSPVDCETNPIRPVTDGCAGRPAVSWGPVPVRLHRARPVVPASAVVVPSTRRTRVLTPQGRCGREGSSLVRGIDTGRRMWEWGAPTKNDASSCNT